MVSVEPEQRVSKEEVANLRPAVVEDLRAPVAMFPQPRIRMLIKVGPVKIPQTVKVVGEVSRHPVEDHTVAVTVQVIDEVGEVIGCAVAGGWSKVADRLISPASVERVFGD